MTRDERIDALLELFTCPHCDEIRTLDSSYNGERICDRCKSRAWAGHRRVIDVRQDDDAVRNATE